MNDLPVEYLDPATPSDVQVSDRARPPIDDPTLGIDLRRASPVRNAKHPLVTIGDSLTHGLSSGAVFDTAHSWPALVAQGINASRFLYPHYGGPMNGLPLNLEALCRKLEDHFGDDISILEKLALPIALQRAIDDNEDYWEGRASSKPPAQRELHNNLGIYGWDLRDALSYTAGRAADGVALPTEDSFLGTRPDRDNDIAASSVLAPFGRLATQVSAASSQAADGGIDTMIVALGSNNALGSVVDKNVRWSADGFDHLDRKHAYNVWRPTHFAREYTALARAMKDIDATRVVFMTVPHVTVAPIAKGVNPENPGNKWRDGSRYFPYYIDPWIPDEDFRVHRHRHLTHQQARAVDSAIDQYNETITRTVRTARQEGYDWLLMDLCAILDGLAQRRYLDDTAAADRNDIDRYILPPEINTLTTRMFLSDRTGRIQGGLFGLDNVHPTTSGYGVIAQAVLDLLRDAGLQTSPVDFTRLLGEDTLNTRPPVLMKQLFEMASPFLRFFASRT